VIYRSVNGRRGFGAPIRAQGGDTTEARIEGLTPGKNPFPANRRMERGRRVPSFGRAGGSLFPAGLSAATGGGDGAPGILLVQGFDRLDPGLSPRQRVAEKPWRHKITRRRDSNAINTPPHERSRQPRAPRPCARIRRREF
jgi:hypothetical protein